MMRWWYGALLAGLLVAVEGARFCPQYCSCFTDPDGYVSANCSVEALGQVEPSQVEMLSFQPRLGGYPTHLAPRAFLAFRNVKFLWMVNCSVLDLPGQVFHGLQYVIRLDLSYNKIRHLNGAVFKSLGSLTTLKLRSNPLELTPWDAIVSDSLQELDLGYCGLRTIPYGTFVSVPRLSRLYLDGNQLRTFTYNTIPVGLRYINLSRNRISNVPTDVLSAMSNLRMLDLSKNPINCTCNLLVMQDWFSGQGIIFDNSVTCVEPSQYKGMRLSKINENELCTLEEVKRHRRINDIRSYRDSKSHRTHNMIRDPDLQSDQPNYQNDAEILFPDSGLTHMELSSQHFPLSTDLSYENNKVAESKQEVTSSEVEHASPTQITEAERDEESSKEVLMNGDEQYSAATLSRMEGPDNGTESLENSFSLDSNSTEEQEGIGRGQYTTWSSEWLTSDASSTNLTYNKHSDSMNDSRTGHDDLIDEGYSPVFNTTDIMLSDAEGSGDELMDIKLAGVSTDEGTSTPHSETFTFPSSHSDVSDYSYDSQHDYSSEVTAPTTEPFSTTLDEGSGEGENESSSPSSSPSMWTEEDDIESTTEGFLLVNETTPDSWSTENYNSSSSIYSSSSEQGTSETSTASYSYSSPFSEESSSEPSISSSTSESSPDFSIILSTSEEPSSSPEIPQSSSQEPTVSVGVFGSSSGSTETTTESLSTSSSSHPMLPAVTIKSAEEVLPTSMSTTVVPSSSTTQAALENEVIVKTHTHETKGHIKISPATEEAKEKATLTYVILGIVLALVLLIVTLIVCRKVSQMRPCSSKKKVRLPQDTEANHGTEMQDMLLPKPPENGVKIISQNGHGKEAPERMVPEKEEEVPVLQKDWDEKSEPIETVTARMSILAGPQTPVFIHKTLA